MRRNEIITKLIAEGFSEKTLANMSDTQINLLSERIIGEQVTTLKKGSVVSPKTTTSPIDIKRLTDQGINVELREEEKETKESPRTFANQNRKNMPQGTKFQAGRANKNKFKNEERAKVTSITKPFVPMKHTNEIKEEEKNIDEKSVSKKQQRFMGMVHATQKGDIAAPSPEVAKVAKSMTKSDAKDFAKTKHKGLPEKVKEECTECNKQMEEKKGEKWIQKAISKPGSLKKALGVPKDEKIPEKKLSAAAKKGGKIGKKARLAQTLKSFHEGKEIKEWVNGLVEQNYHSMTTKNEIMEMIKEKLNEQAAAPGVAEPTIKPTAKPGKPPKPDKPSYPSPWEPPRENPNPDPGPKFETGKLPDFLKYDNIVASVEGNDTDQLAEEIIKKLKDTF